MKRILTALAITISIVAVGLLSFEYGRRIGAEHVHAAMEKDAVSHLANNLYMLGEIEKGNVSDVKRMLQASTNGYLETVIVYGRPDSEPGYGRFRCVVLTKLKKYREDNRLFTTPDWDYLWKASGMREAEDRRIAFLSRDLPVWCPHSSQ
jgi:hypothetical protein